jgi:hypothetical protein
MSLKKKIEAGGSKGMKLCFSNALYTTGLSLPVKDYYRFGFQNL